MANKTYTIMFLPHAEANFKKLQISKKKVILICSSIILFILITFYLLYSFVSLHLKLADYNRTKENETKLARVVSKYQDDLESAVNKTKEMNELLNLLMNSLNFMAGIGGDNETGNVRQPDKFSKVLNNLKQGRVDEFLDDFEMRLNQFKKEKDFFTHSYKNVSMVYKQMDQLYVQMPSISPSKGWLCSHFGHRKDPFTGKRAFHKGIDISNMKRAVAVIATADGTVIQAGYDGGFGITVVINHPLTNFKTRYAHMKKIFVKPGQKVKRGDRIGTMGSTGRSTGKHLHYEVLYRNRHQNPIDFILDRDVFSQYQ